MHADTRTIRVTAPLRISFVGGGTDFAHYFEQHCGAVLSSTIDHHVRVRITPRRDRQVRVRSLDLGRLVEYHLDQGPDGDAMADLATAAIERVGIDGGIDVATSSDAPPGSGLGGSSALVTAMVAGLAMLGRRRMTAHEVARLSHTIEREDLAITGGWQDQYAAAFGGFNLLTFSRDGVEVEPVRADPSVIRALGRNLLLCYTGTVRRTVGLIDAQIRLFEEGREDTILGMKRLHEMAYAMRDAVEAGHPDELGRMLDEAFLAKKLMNPHIAERTPIERMLEVARRAGTVGGKICGAGGGGYLLLYCRPAEQPAVRSALEGEGGQFAPFAFRQGGVTARRGDDVWTPTT